jgi:hypothetical protein
MNLWNRTSIAVVTGLILSGWLASAGAQDKGSARDLQNSCLVSDIPALDQLSVTWTGDCAGGRASGVGHVFAFSRGELRYILRGQFSNGLLTRRDQFRPCAGDACSDQVAAAVLREHETLARQRQTAQAAPAAAVSAAPLKVEIHADDAVYRGNFVLDPKTRLLSGDGRAEFFDGRVFIGQLENGKKVGRCTYLWPDGQRYVGDWRDDLQDGVGEWTSAQGDRYVGEYRFGKREGKGVMTYANRMEYDGEWLADRPSGNGKFRFQNGDVYEGQVLAGQQTGSGTLTQKSGDRYVGQWLRGERDGKGQAEWKNGQRYEGDWRRDRKHGNGSMRFPDGGTYDGQWREDHASGQGSVTFASGDTYAGDVLDGVPQGKGLYKWGSGDRFEGEFNAGKPTANGILTFYIETTPSAVTVATVEPAAPAAVAPADAGPVAGSSAGAVVVSKATLCSRGYNAARGVSALRRFMELFPDDECGRHALARQKIAVIEDNERKAARELEERAAQARALVGLVVAYRQEYSFCASGSGSNCQSVLYQFQVKGRIKDVDLARQGAQVQVQEVALLANEKGVSAQLFAQGRSAALESFRSRMVGTIQWKTKTELGLAF